MKKIYSAIFLCAGGMALAQAPTITMADMPSIGTIWTEFTDTSTTGFVITPPSASAQTWNYSTAFGAVSADVASFVSPTGLQGASLFPGSNIAQTSPSDSTNTFFVKNTSGVYIDGNYIYTSSPSAFDFNPNWQLIPTPVTYNSSIPVNNSKMSMSMAGPGYSVDYVIRYKTTFTADAFGSLTTPAGTFPNTLRVKSFRQSWDSTYLTVPPNPPMLNSSGTDTVTTYFWLRNSGSGNSIVMTASLDASGTITSTSYFSATVGINDDVNMWELKIFPNPSKDVVTISLPKKESARLEIFDLSGKKVIEMNGDTDRFSVSISNLNTGVYFYSLKTDSYIKTGRLIHE